MGRKALVPFEQKLKAVDEYLSGRGSQETIAKKYGVGRTPFNFWVRNYKALGEKGLMESHTNASYSFDLKQNAVLDYLNGNGSLDDICLKYKIKSTHQLRNWILKYNGHKELKASGIGGKAIMTKGRTTTFEERIEIVKFCLEHNKNYNEAAKKYQISYHQVRNWTVKYETLGVDALTDRRGKRKSEDQLSEVERLKAQNKLLEAKNNRLEMENEVLKKLEEIERRWS